MGNEEEDKWLEQFAFISSLIRMQIPLGRKGKISAVAAERFLGVTPKKWNAWARGQRPSAGDLECIGRRLGLTSQWLLYGEGAPFVENAVDASSPVEQADVRSAADIEGEHSSPASLSAATVPGSVFSGLSGVMPLPLTGLAECGIQGWYREAHMRAPVAPPQVGEGWMAVMAVGDSMIPAGIREGHILYCDPDQPPVVGEPIYVLRADGAASIKMWQGIAENGFAVLQGWLPPDAQGNQSSYLDQLAPGQIAKLAPVIYVRLRI